MHISGLPGEGQYSNIMSSMALSMREAVVNEDLILWESLNAIEDWEENTPGFAYWHSEEESELQVARNGPVAILGML